MTDLPLLRGYPDDTLEGVRALLAEGRLGAYVAAKYPDRHPHTTNKLLRAYVDGLRKRHMKTTPAIAKVVYDDRLVAAEDALGLHVFESRAHGARLRARSELRVAGLFRDAAPEFLRMIVVHELAHLREFDHNKAFYRLCTAIEPEYHQYEFDLRLWLTARELEGDGAEPSGAAPG
jgi:predicted metal-dependent hydrolase